MSHTTAVPKPLLKGLCFALAWTAMFVLASEVQGALRADFDSWHQAVSALSLGPNGWIQSVNFVLFGMVLIGTAFIWRRILAGGDGAAAYPLLTVITGAAFVMAAFLPQDPAPGYDPENLQPSAPTLTGLLHLLVAAIAALSSVAGLFVMARRFSGDQNWKGWPAYTRLVAILMVGCIVVYGFWSTKSTGFAGTFERIALLLPGIWACAVVWRLWQGTPLMVVRGSTTSQ